MADEMDVNVVGKPDATQRDDFSETALKLTKDPIEADSVKDMGDKILGRVEKAKKAGKKPCVKNLNIIGHAASGVISVGGGKKLDVLGKRIDGDVTEWGAELGRLATVLCKGAVIRLVGCEVGKGDEGLSS